MIPSLEHRDGLRILVVDDEPNELRALVIGLRLEGFDARPAPDGSTAIGLLSEGGYSAVLAELMMPQMNGLQLAREIRTSHPDVTTILMSAYHLSPVQLARAGTGVVGFVPKPYRFDELVEFIKSKVELRSPWTAPFRAAKPQDGGFPSPFDVPPSPVAG